MIAPPLRSRPVLLGSILIAVVVLAAGLLLQHHWRQQRLWDRLLMADSRRLMQEPELTTFAILKAKPLFAAHCAACHGADMTGDRAQGAPNLADQHWLFGDGSVFDIERTILYGVRSERGKSHNVTDMPPFGLTGRLSEAEIRNVVQYLLQLSGKPHQAGAASEGRRIYFDVAKANCADCHGESAQGNSNYGAPDLTADAWHSGDEAELFYQAIYSGQHRMMPGWIGSLTLAQIRALAVYVYAKSHESAHG